MTNRTFHILRELQRAFDVSIVAFSRANHQPDAVARETARAALAEMLSSVAEPTPVPSEQSRITKAMVHLRSLISGAAYVDHEYASAAFGARLEETIRESRPDLVHVDSLDLHKWLDRVGAAPVACTHHSIESELLRLRGDHHGSRILRPYLRMQAERYLALEQVHTPRFAVNVMMSELDADRLRAIAPGARTVSIPNGVDPEALRPGSEAEVDPDLVAFLGPAYMYPNRDGMEYFLEEVWPKVLAARPSTRLNWIGRMSLADRERFGRHPRVRCLGFVEALGRELGSAACLVVPLRIGGGTRLKILDAWAAGKAVVSTSVGCEGLKTEDGGNIVVRDDSKEFTDAVIRVLDDPEFRRRIGTSARRTVEEGYSWSAIGDKLNAEYTRILAG